MKVYDTNLTGTCAAESGRAQETQRTERSGQGQGSRIGGAGGDQVELSGALGRLSQALSTFQEELRRDLAEQVTLLQANLQAEPVTIHDLPSELQARYVGTGHADTQATSHSDRGCATSSHSAASIA